jgi:hypothetical protein
MLWSRPGKWYMCTKAPRASAFGIPLGLFQNLSEQLSPQQPPVSIMLTPMRSFACVVLTVAVGLAGMPFASAQSATPLSNNLQLVQALLQSGQEQIALSQLDRLLDGSDATARATFENLITTLQTSNKPELSVYSAYLLLELGHYPEARLELQKYLALELNPQQRDLAQSLVAQLEPTALGETRPLLQIIPDLSSKPSGVTLLAAPITLEQGGAFYSQIKLRSSGFLPATLRLEWSIWQAGNPLLQGGKGELAIPPATLGMTYRTLRLVLPEQLLGSLELRLNLSSADGRSSQSVVPLEVTPLKTAPRSEILLERFAKAGLRWVNRDGLAVVDRDVLDALRQQVLFAQNQASGLLVAPDARFGPQNPSELFAAVTLDSTLKALEQLWFQLDQYDSSEGFYFPKAYAHYLEKPL